MTDTNVRLNTAKGLVSRGGNVCYSPGGIIAQVGLKDRATEDFSSVFQVGRNDFRILCAGGVCTVQQWVPKVQSFREDALQALAAIVTLGLASCSSNGGPKEWQDVAEFQDVKNDSAAVQQPEVLPQATEVKDTKSSSKQCFDSDGDNYFGVGFVSTDPATPTQKTYVDICKDTAFLYEQTCNENQRKQVIIKCVDVLPGGMCVQDATGGKCDLASKYIGDAGPTGGSSDTPEVSAPVDTGPDVLDVPPEVPLVDYLKQNPLPLALDVVGKYYNASYTQAGCMYYGSNIYPTELSKCIYLQAIYDVDGNPIVSGSYTDLVSKIAKGGNFFTALIVPSEGKYPKTSIGEVVAFTHSEDDMYGISPGASPNLPTIMANLKAQVIAIQFIEIYEGPSNPYKSDYCSFTYLAPNGFSSCAK